MDRTPRLLVTALALLVSVAVRATEPDPPPHLHRVAGNVHMLDYGTKDNCCGGNVAILVGSDALLLVDAQGSRAPKLQEVLAQQLSPLPIRFVVNTHCDGDHTGGNARLIEAGAQVIATPQARERLEKKQCGQGRLGLPAVLVESRLTIHLPDEEIVVTKLPTGHTDGDAAVYFRNANVLHTGDAFVSYNLPFANRESGGDILGIAPALREILKLAPEDARIIPGHGPEATMRDVRRAVEALDGMRDAVAHGMAQGRSLEELRAAKVLSSWNGVAGGDSETDFYLRDFYRALAR